MHQLESKSLSSPQQNFLLSFIAPHPAIESDIARRQARLSAAISLSFSAITLIAVLSSALLTKTWSLLFTFALLFSGVSFVAYLLSRSVVYERAPLVLLAGFLLLAYVASFWGEYPALFLSLTFSVFFLLTNLLSLKWMVGIILSNTVVVILLASFFLPGLQGIEALNTFAGIFTLGLFVLLFAWHRESLERLRLEEIRQAQRVVEERNRLLEKAQVELKERFDEIQLAAEVGRAISQVRALDDLLQDAVERIRARFDLYYAQVYLVNPAKTHLVLQSGSGEVGATLRARKHQLPLNTGSINGRAAIEKKPVVIADTTNSAVFKPNPLLPHTRSEMAVPLLLGDQVVGVLDMQSEKVGGLTDEMLPAFQALAGQLAVAVQNAQLLAQAEQARAEVEEYARRLERRAWQEYLDSVHKPEEIGYLFENHQIHTLEQAVLPENPAALVVPIVAGNEPIGSLVVELDESQKTSQTQDLVYVVARQVAQHLEDLRLLEMAERYRIQSEQAARRLTREGWEEYLKTRKAESLGYLYDTRQVIPLEAVSTLQAETALTVPVRVREETIGKLTVLDADPEDTETLELVSLVTERLSEHLETLRLLEETRRGQIELDRRAQQLAAVSEISTVSSREQDIQNILKTVARLTRQKFNLYHCRIYTYDPVRETLRAVAFGWTDGTDENLEDETLIPLAQEQSLVARVARTREPVLVNDVRADPGWLPNPLLPETRAELAVPLVIGEDVLGVLDVQSERQNAFSEEDINIQVTLAAQVATALQNARNYERARRQAEREALLNAISQKIQSATSVEAVLQIAARELGHALRAPRAIAQLSLKDS